MGSVEVTAPSPAVDFAWKSSFLCDLPERLAAGLLESSRLERMQPAELMLRGKAAAGDAGVFLLVEGLVRVYLVGPDGRQATVRYASETEVIGLPPLLVVGMDIWAEAVTEVSAVRLSSQRFIALAERNVELAWPTALYVAQQLASTNDVLAADIFLPVRARLARHLLDLAQRQPDGLFVPARHQHLADAIGSVREVVSREMKRLCDEGLIRRVGDGTRIEDPAALHRISTGCAREQG